MRPSLSKTACAGTHKTFAQRLGGDHDSGAHAGTQLRRRIVDRNLAIEMAIPGRPGGAADILDVARERFFGKGDYGNFGLLPLRQMPAIQLADARTGLPIGQIRNLRHGHAGPNRIAHLQTRQTSFLQT